MAWHDGTRRLHHDELVSWKSAAEAFGHLSRISDDLLERLIARLKSGELEAAAADAKWQERGGNLSTGLVVLVGKWWSAVDGGNPGHYRELFKTGRISLYVPDPVSGALFKVDFAGIRFKPSDLAAALDPASQVAQPRKNPNRSHPAAVEAPTFRPPAHLPTSSPAWDAGTVTQAEFQTWYTVPETVSLFANELVMSIQEFGPRLMARLHDGELDCAVESLTQYNGAKANEPTKNSYRRLERSIWRYAAPDNAFWKLSEIDIDIRTIPSSSIRLRGVRFDPAGLARMIGRPILPKIASSLALAVHGTAPSLPPALQRSVEVEVEVAAGEAPTSADLNKGLRKTVSDATLRAWWELCKTLKPADAWSMDDMRAFFERCLPEKSATRERLRNVRGRQKSGPKAGPAK